MKMIRGILEAASVNQKITEDADFALNSLHLSLRYTDTLLWLQNLIYLTFEERKTLTTIKDKRKPNNLD